MRSLSTASSTLSSRGSLAGNGGVLRNDSILYFTVLGARGLKNTQKLGVQDPYCSVSLVSHGKEPSTPQFKTTTHDNGGTDPIWNEKGMVLVTDVASDVLKIRILNENWVGSNVIGECAVSMRELSRGRSMEKEFALTPRGFVRVLMYLALAHENPTTHTRAEYGQYPQHFLPGRSKLLLSIVTGEKLRDIQSIGTQDPYCQVFISRSRVPTPEEMVYKTKTHDNGGKNPKWMEAVTAGVRCIEHDFLIIRVMNDNHLKDELIGEVCFKLELLVGRCFEDKMLPIEADDTIVGQLRVQLALFNDEVVDENGQHDTMHLDSDLDGCTCSLKTVKRATKVGDVILSGVAPDGVHYLEAGSVVSTGCALAGDYVLDKDFWDGDEF